jgi:hypothetical protein
MTSNLERLSNILDAFFKEETISKLQEPKENMFIEFISDNQKFLSFSFDKQPLPKNDFPKGIFPFFNRGTGKVTSFCDYIIFTEKAGILYVLLIELKSGKDNVIKQLEAGRCFAEYIISTLNRVYNLNISPQIRKISIRKTHLTPKPQRKKKIDYIDNFHTFCDSKFWLKKYLD